MKKIFVMLLYVLMVVAMLIGCGSQVAQQGEITPHSFSEPTEATASDEELALNEYISSNSGEKVAFDGIEVSFKGNSCVVTSQSTVDSVKPIFEVESENSEDVSTLEVEDPGILSVGQRLSYNKIVNDGGKALNKWVFFADFSKETGCVSWVELDPFYSYNSEETPLINGVGIGTSFKALLEAWGKPDVATATLKNGEDIAIVNYMYDIGNDDGTTTCVYVCLSVGEDGGFKDAVVHDIYINTLLAVEG